jgi:hypothetical protein
MNIDTEINVGLPAEALTEEDQQLLNDSYKELPQEDKSLGDNAVVDKPPVEKQEGAATEDEEALGPEHDGKTDDEREQIRERRRQERAQKKQYAKEKEQSYKREIESLKRQVSEMNEWKNTVEQRRVNSGVAQLDKALKDSLDAIEVAKQAIKQATENQDGAALVDAQELYYAARKRSEDLGRVRQQIAQRQSRPPQQNIDRAVVNHAQKWMEGKDWYDPTGKNPDSRVALAIDNTLAEEGWDPRTPEYWTELDSRLKNYLPNRYNSAYTEHKRDETPRPPTGASSQSRTSEGSTNFTLSPERVRAMKEAGMWDDPEKRKSMIRRYVEQDRNSKK